MPNRLSNFSKTRPYVIPGLTRDPGLARNKFYPRRVGSAVRKGFLILSSPTF